MQTAVVITIERLQETPSCIYSYINIEVCVNCIILQPSWGCRCRELQTARLCVWQGSLRKALPGWRSLCRDNSTSECKMLQITEGSSPNTDGSPCPVAPLTRQQQDKGQAGAGDNTQLAFNRTGGSEKRETRLINWESTRMINGKNLESKEQKGMQGETNRVFEVHYQCSEGEPGCSPSCR